MITSVDGEKTTLTYTPPPPGPPVYIPPTEVYQPPGYATPGPETLQHGYALPSPSHAYPPPQQQYAPPQGHTPQSQGPTPQSQNNVHPGDQYRAELFAQCAQGVHQPTTKYGVCGIITAVVLFPFGLICLFMDTEQKCDRCGVRLS